MAVLLQDLRYALRQLVKTPAFTITAVLTLALGIGVNAAMFSVIDQVLLRPLPYQSASRIVEIGPQPDSGNGFGSVSWPDIKDWRARSHSFQQIGFYSMQFSTVGKNANATLTPKLAVSTNFLKLFGVQPMLGRGFSADDSKPGRNDVLILSHSTWQKTFHSDRGIIGKTVKINGDPYQVIGVMRPSFTFPADMGTGEEIFVPMNLDDPGTADRGNSGLQPMGLLRPGVPVEQARNELNSIHRRLLHEYPKDERKEAIKVTTYRNAITADARPALLALIWAVLAVWLIACANVAGLMLTRTASRRREIAIRGALGAPHGRLVQQFFTESLLLGLCGGAVGLGLAAAAIQLLKHYLGRLPFGEDVHINVPVLLFLLFLSCFSAVLFGLVPAWHSANLPAQEGLREGTLGAGTSRNQSRLRDAFVVGEITLTLALLIAAGLMMQTLLSLRHTNLGFVPEHVVTGAVFFPTHGVWWAVKEPDKAPNIVQTFYQPLLEKLRHTPGIEDVGIASVRPLEPNWSFVDSVVLKSRPNLDKNQEPSAQLRAVNGAYFRTFGIRLMRGRFFNDQDTPDAPVAAVVNQAFVKKVLPNEDPIGKQLQVNDKGPRQWATIVGVAENVHQKTPGESPLPELDLNLTQFTPTDDLYPIVSTFLTNVAVRTRLPAATAEQLIRRSVHALQPQAALDKVEPMQQVVDESLGGQTLAARLLAIFGFAALLIAVAGIYGLLAYSVSQRTRELGVRLALGAQRGDVLWLVMRHALWLLGIGIALGIGLALATGGVLRSFIYGLGGYDALTVFLVALLLTVCGVAASYFPARRAASIDPVEALRAE